MNVKEQVMRARMVFLRTHYDPPTLLFVSPDFHTEICLWLQGRDEGYYKSVAGRQMCGLTIHLVPTLDRGFHVA